jgi:hypothetical protein
LADSGTPVPPPFRRAFEQLAELGSTQVEALAGALSDNPDRISTSALGVRAREAVPELDDADAIRIIQALMSLVAQERFSSTGVGGLADRVASSADLELPDTQRPELQQRLERLSSATAIRTALKAHDLITEHQHVFTGARLFTDLRPVFGDVASDSPVGAVVVAMLKIEHAASEFSPPEAFFVALDQGDLQTLKAVIDRALQKTETLARWVSSTGLAYWEYDEEVGRGQARE